MILISLILLFLNLFSPDLFNNISRIIFPQIFLTKFSELGFENLSSYPRIFIWQSTLDFISQRPLLGWGAGTFPILYENKTNLEPYAHPHSLILDLANSYGILPSLIITFFVIYILGQSFKKIYFSFNKSISFDKAWWASTFSLALSQLVDIQYFDIRISITFWILLAGLTCKIKE